MRRLEFFYDCSSPWTYLAFDRIEGVVQDTGAELVWKPILVGGVFNTVNPSVYESRQNPVAPKVAYYEKDMQDWARHQGLRIGTPPVFPVNSAKAMRGALFAEEERKVAPYSRAIFEAYWGELRDISQDDVLRDIVIAVGLDPEQYFARVTDPVYKDRLRSNTEELVARGGFGSPTFFVDHDDMYFGNDRLNLVRDALER